VSRYISAFTLLPPHRKCLFSRSTDQVVSSQSGCEARINPSKTPIATLVCTVDSRDHLQQAHYESQMSTLLIKYILHSIPSSITRRLTANPLVAVVSQLEPVWVVASSPRVLYEKARKACSCHVLNILLSYDRACLSRPARRDNNYILSNDIDERTCNSSAHEVQSHNHGAMLCEVGGLLDLGQCPWGRRAPQSFPAEELTLCG
jgi:hypothetical protein